MDFHTRSTVRWHHTPDCTRPQEHIFLPSYDRDQLRKRTCSFLRNSPFLQSRLQKRALTHFRHFFFKARTLTRHAISSTQLWLVTNRFRTVKTVPPDFSFWTLRRRLSCRCPRCWSCIFYLSKVSRKPQTTSYKEIIKKSVWFQNLSLFTRSDTNIVFVAKVSTFAHARIFHQATLSTRKTTGTAHKLNAKWRIFQNYFF